jgi:hypothetical protein
MSDKKPSNSEKSENKQDRTEHRLWSRKQQQGRGQHEKKKDPEETPILRFGLKNNIAKVKEALANKALREYGDLGRLIELGEYYVPEPPDVTDNDLVNDSFGPDRAAYLVPQKLYTKHWKDMHNNRAKLYALI